MKGEYAVRWRTRHGHRFRVHEYEMIAESAITAARHAIGQDVYTGRIEHPTRDGYPQFSFEPIGERRGPKVVGRVWVIRLG